MTSIRAFESGDVPAVALLLRAHMPGWVGTDSSPPTGLDGELSPI